MRIFLAIVCYVGILLAASRWTYCSSGWLLFSIVPILWLDRYVFQLIPRQEPAKIIPAILLRLGYFLIGGVGFYVWYYPASSLVEAVNVGMVVSLVGFLLELVLSLAARATYRRERPPSRLQPVGMALVLIVPLVILLPLRNFHPLHRVPVQTPAALGVKFEDVTLTTEDGLELGAWFIPHLDPRGTVIFCHGHEGNRAHVLGMLQALRDVQLNVLAFDFRGHGASPGHTVTFGAREVADVKAAEQYIANRFPDMPIFLVGASYGAAVAIQALPELPHVKAAWLDSPFARLSDVADQEFHWLSPGIRKELIGFYTTVLFLDCRFWALDVNPIDVLKQVKGIPLYFSHGKNDHFISFQQGEELFNAYQGPKEHFWMESTSHFHRPQAVNDEYTRRLKQFLEEQVTAAGKTMN